ncbi:hypothetical protein Aduo_002965 [Ancylostoma duodenale]
MAALGKIVTLCLRFQDADSLAIDDMESSRATVHALLDGSITKEVHRELVHSKSPLQGFDGQRNRRLDDYFLDHYHTQLSQNLEMVQESMRLLETSCAIPQLRSHLTNFYASLHGNVKKTAKWPKNLRADDSSLRLYRAMLSNSQLLSVDDKVEKMFQCILAIPSSNADPERTFSTANALTAGERSSLATTTINTVMHVQNNGLSLLTLAPLKLAYQWIHPLPGLGLPSGIHSTIDTSTNIMAIIHEALFQGKLDDATKIEEIMGTQVDMVQILNIFSEQAMKALPARSKNDVDKHRKDIVDTKSAKASIFNIGAEQHDQQHEHDK